jgi:hypothetical protein
MLWSVFQRRGLFAVVAAATTACAATNAGGSTAPVPLLFRMEHNGQAPNGLLYVYDTGRWEYASWAACNAVKGTVADAQMNQLRMYIASPELARLRSEDAGCSSTSYELVTHTDDRTVCWSSHENDVTDSLVAFLEARVAELHWDGTVRDCKGPPPSVSPSPSPLSPNVLPSRREGT